MARTLGTQLLQCAAVQVAFGFQPLQPLLHLAQRESLTIVVTHDTGILLKLLPGLE